MLFTSFFQWWYGLGWRQQVAAVRERCSRMVDMFSLPILVRTFFEPFKQIDAGSGGTASLPVLLRRWVDRTFSRVFGAVVRLLFGIAGVIAVCVVAVLGLIWLVVWPLIPLGPVVGFVLSVSVGLNA